MTWYPGEARDLFVALELHIPGQESEKVKEDPGESGIVAGPAAVLYQQNESSD